MDELDAVRGPLLREAIRSPVLLSDLAGLEDYVAQTYDSRSFVELLQNADDASAARFAVIRSGDHILVGNDGRPFNREDLLSLCRSAASNKRRGETIGYRGIGFKSVVGFAHSVFLVSGPFEVAFSRERTAKDIPDASRVPLVRIPHRMTVEDKAPFEQSLQNLLDEGMTTVFVFADLFADAVENEFLAFEPSSLLFLHNVRQVRLRGRTDELITVRRTNQDRGRQRLELASAAGVEQWTVLSNEGVDVAVPDTETNASTRESAVVHAFVPTKEPSGFRFKVNADISTDPSRTRLVFDAQTHLAIESVARVVVSLLDDALQTTDLTMLEALDPLVDVGVVNMRQRSFAGELVKALKSVGESMLHHYVLAPAWLNVHDSPSWHVMAVQTLSLQPPARRFAPYSGTVGYARASWLISRQRYHEYLSQRRERPRWLLT